MGKEKGGFLTPKAIANRIKSKGLQKLRWYCQMCQKQCRDENGFKCHCMSESHQRQLLLFAENPDKYLDSFSQEFLDDFMELMKRRFGTKRVHCNIVYQEYISERDHTHMNSTQWGTLTELVKWLGQEGHCVVDETPKGWYITYIDRDPETIERQKKMQSKEKMELDDEERMAKFLEQQIERAKDVESEKHEIVHTDLQRENEDEKVQFDFSKPSTSKTEQPPQKSSASSNPLKQVIVKKTSSLSPQSSSPSSSSSTSTKHPVKRKSALEEILQEEKAKKRKPERQENWITKDIVVKIITKKLGDKYYKKKGFVKEVKNLFVAIVEILDSGDVLKLDQAHLETVIPQPGRLVKIVNGPYRGLTAKMMELDEKSFSVSVKLEDGSEKGKKVPSIAYEDICKLA